MAGAVWHRCSRLFSQQTHNLAGSRQDDDSAAACDANHPARWHSDAKYSLYLIVCRRRCLKMSSIWFLLTYVIPTSPVVCVLFISLYFMPRSPLSTLYPIWASLKSLSANCSLKISSYYNIYTINGFYCLTFHKATTRIAVTMRVRSHLSSNQRFWPRARMLLTYLWKAKKLYDTVWSCSANEIKN